MKKLITALLMLAAILTPLHSFGYSFEVNGIYYNIISSTNKTVSVTYKDTSYNSYSGDISIPNMVSYNNINYSVTWIGISTFRDCTGLTSIGIPNSVTSIGEKAFSYCTGLTSVTIPNSVTSIGGSAFSYCIGLTSVIIGDSVTSISSNAFSGCTGLTSVTISDSVTSIGNYAFFGCTGLTEVTIPNSVTSIESNAFLRCTGLTSVTIPNSVTSIGDYAFYDCKGLDSVTIPNSVTSIGNYAFYGCWRLLWVFLGTGVKSIGDRCFYECTNLKVIINNSGLKIGGASNGYVGYYATKIYSNVQLNRNDDFIFIHTTDETAIIEYIGRNNNTIIPSSIDGHKVTSVASTTFANAKGIVSLTIGENVLSIESNALENCTSLYKLILMPNTPPSGLTSNLSNLEGRVTYVANNNYTGSVLGTIRKLDS